MISLSLWQWIYRILIIIANLVFFIYSDPIAIIWLVGLTLLGYAMGLELGERLKTCEIPGNRTEGRGKCKNILIITIVLIVGVLVFFKYGDLVTGQRFIVPLGLSYYSLMIIGYLIDVYRGEVECEKNILIFSLYVGFFPQATAGPIGRAKELLNNYRKRITVSPQDVKIGLLMITLGVYEKFVMADNLSMVVDNIVRSQAKGTTLAVAFLLYSLVIYYDFAGYSQIAIGIGRLMGIRLMDNFHAPYLATSLKDFWRRWHISLSSWFRDYLYIPLGGSRRGYLRQILGILLVFILSGAWHGQALGFWMWGLIHGVSLVIENCFRRLFKNIKCASKAVIIPLNMLKRIAVFMLVSFAWIPFYAGDVDKAFSIYGRLFSADTEFAAQIINGFGLRVEVWIVIGISVLLYLFISILDEQYKYTLYEKIADHGWIILILAIDMYTVLLLAGVYGSEYDAATFIYGGF